MGYNVMLSCFDYTQTMAKPWARSGIVSVCVDIKHPPGYTQVDTNLYTLGTDIQTWNVPPDWNILFASFCPPCTDVAVSGAKHFQKKGLRSLIQSLSLFNVCIEIGEKLMCPYVIENPVSTVSTYYRKPDYVFDPCDYPLTDDDLYTKRTCLWVGNGFRMPVKHRQDPILGSKMHRIPPGVGRQAVRSVTPHGFATAVFNANYFHAVTYVLHESMI